MSSSPLRITATCSAPSTRSVPGERDAIEPGLVGLVDQLKRLHVLSASADPADVAGLSFHFANVTTRTQYLSPALAEVSITGGHVSTAYDLAKLPLGSFVTGIAGAALHRSQSSTQRANTGQSGIVAVKQNGSWYVSLGYTEAVDSLRAGGHHDVLPPPAASRRRAAPPPTLQSPRSCGRPPASTCGD